MPKYINNKGIGFVPILVSIFVLLIGAGVTYSYMNKSNDTVLGERKPTEELLSQNSKPGVPDITDPKDPAGVTQNSIQYVFVPNGNSQYNGKIVVQLKTWNKQMQGLAASLNIDGVGAEDFYSPKTGQKSPSRTVQIPEKGRNSRDLSKSIYASYEKDVWSWTNTVSICLKRTSDQCKGLKMTNVSVPKGWKASADGLSISREEVGPTFLLTVLKQNTQDSYVRVGVSGIGVKTFEAVRILQSKGIEISSGESADSVRKTILKPTINDIRADGFYSFDIVVPNYALSLNMLIDADAKASGKVPSNWKFSNGTLFERAIAEDMGTVSLTSSALPAKGERLTFSMKGFGASFNQNVKSLRNSGLVVCPAKKPCLAPAKQTVTCSVDSNSFQRICNFSINVPSDVEIVKAQDSDLKVNYNLSPTVGWKPSGSSGSQFSVTKAPVAR